jgi:hypothetical protein
MKEISANPTPAGIQNHLVLDDGFDLLCPFVEQNRGLLNGGTCPHFLKQQTVAFLVQIG